MTELEWLRPYRGQPRRPSFIAQPNDCWEWQGGKNKLGYGTRRFNGKRVGAHRSFYEELVGPIPVGLELDHLCRNPSCVNPTHLEPVTSRQNTNRGIAGDVNRVRRMMSVARTTPQQREAAYRGVVFRGENGAEWARRLGVFKNNVYQWIKVRRARDAG